jgi:hypothetical protein
MRSQYLIGGDGQSISMVDLQAIGLPLTVFRISRLHAAFYRNRRIDGCPLWVISGHFAMRERDV